MGTLCIDSDSSRWIKLGDNTLGGTFGSSFVRFSGPLGIVSLHMKINLIGVSSPMLSLLIPDLSR